MKRVKVLFPVVAIVMMVFSLSSCLEDSEPSPSIAYVTITGDELFGFKLYADGGVILEPSISSIPYLEYFSTYKRAMVLYRIPEGVTIPDPLEETSVIKVNIVDWSPIGATEVINLQNNQLAVDSLTANNDSLRTFGIFSAYKGYITAVANLFYESNSKMPYWNVAYHPEDISEDTLKLVMYYNKNSKSTYLTEARFMSSFELPASAYGLLKPKNDSIVIELQGRVKKEYSNGWEDVSQYCKISTRNYFTPSSW